MFHTLHIDTDITKSPQNAKRLSGVLQGQNQSAKGAEYSKAPTRGIDSKAPTRGIDPRAPKARNMTARGKCEAKQARRPWLTIPKRDEA
jgi:hypothetical protein